MTHALTFDDIERAVIAAVICWPDQALPLVPDVEIDDFGDPFRKHVWTSIRNLEAAGASIEILAIVDDVFAGYQLVNHDKCTNRDEVDVTYKIGALVLEAPHSGGPEEHTRELQRYARALRTIRAEREELMAG
jgi:hypothetical protein